LTIDREKSITRKEFGGNIEEAHAKQHLIHEATEKEISQLKMEYAEIRGSRSHSLSSG
jgi:hypothetical protein